MIVPFEPLIDKPAGFALYVPPVLPVSVTLAVVPPVQYGVPLYAIVALGAAVTVTEVVVLNAAHPPPAKKA